MNSKKRKAAVASLEDRTLFQAFTQSANAVSQLYTAAVQAQRRAEEAGARQALERVAQFVVKEYGNAGAVPTNVLMEVLRHELQAAQGATTAVQLPFPLPLLPTGDAHSDHSDDEALMSGGEAPSPQQPGAFRRTASGHNISPKGPGRAPPGSLPALFQQQQQQQQQQQAAMQHAHLMQQMQQQQQHAQQQQQHAQQPGAPPGGFAMPGYGGAAPYQ